MKKDKELRETASTPAIYKDIFELSPSPIGIFNQDGECLLANRAFYFQLGYDIVAEQKPVITLQALFFRPDLLEKFSELMQKRDVIRRWETRLKTRDGDSISALLSGRNLDYLGARGYEITFTNIAYQEKLEQSIRQGHHRVTSLIENLTVGLFLVDRNGIITEANTALGNLIQCDPESLVAQHYQLLFTNLFTAASDPDILQHTLREAVRVLGQHPVLTVNLNNGRQYLEIRLFPVWDEEGQSLGWGGLVQDITEIREQTAWKLELLSMLAHDLRTPLATLKGHATALLANYKNWGTEMGMEFLKTIDRSVDELIRQVDRNLALTRVETGRLGLRPEAIDPKVLVRQAIERAAGSIGERKIAFDWPNEMAQLRVDPARIEEVIINLLDNAVRYSPSDKPILIKTETLNDRLLISVIDQGPGIPTEKQTEIFEKYVRGEHQDEGTGLGLYISQKIVEAHGGRIWVTSPPASTDYGTGAEFSITLPLLPEMPIERKLEGETREFTATVDMVRAVEDEKILVVEDDADVQALLHTILSQEGYQVEIAPDGPSALDIVQIDPPNIILLDWMIPGMRGLQVCRSIRRWTNIPIIMVTSKTSQADLIAALDAGADDYVTKPFQTEELLARIRALIRRGDVVEIEMEEDQFNADGLSIDFDARSVWLYGEFLKLTPTEYEILVYLARHRGLVVTYDQLIDAIGDPEEKRSRHRLFVHISRLREKIEHDPKNPHFIQTHWGVGYIFLPRK